MRLLAISIVANKVLGRSRNFKILSDDTVSSFSKSCVSCGLMEKKATSAPDIIAEQIMSNNKKMIENPTPPDKSKKERSTCERAKLGGSVSNLLFVR